MRLNPVHYSTTASSLLPKRGEAIASPTRSASASPVYGRDVFKFSGANPDQETSGKKETSEKKEEKAFLVLMASGAAGMVAGAVAGSAVPVIGTLIGSLLGGSIGFLIGASLKNGKQEPTKDETPKDEFKDSPV
ncbi:MAG: hypothetical protein K0Q50_925 [Vampirovibrio sp.]|jgi:phage tail tape-measure protein|nr:hypothetical protein [Vampirovibrio sp.]